MGQKESKIGESIEERDEIIDIISPEGVRQGVSLEIQRIHKIGLEQLIRKISNEWKKPPSYFYNVIIDGIEWRSNEINLWDTGYVGWESYLFVEDEQETSDIEIQIIEIENKLIWENEIIIEKFNIKYNFRTGGWIGDDYFNDTTGYGHYLGDSYEIWFDVHQIDPDGDNIPYWTEINILKTNPTVDDRYMDHDNDGISTAWEWKWGYDPKKWDNHTYIDPENDGLSNIEEYNLRKFLANPYYKDIFIEIDFMEKSDDLISVEHIYPEKSKWMIMDKFNKHFITLHIDDGWESGLTNGGGEFLDYYEDYIGPFDGIASNYYKYHFADERKGSFRYVFMANDAGWNFPQDNKLWPDVISIPSNPHYFRYVYFPPAITTRLKTLALSVALMHELGHTMNLNPPYNAGIDNATQVGRNDLPYFAKLQAKIQARQYWDNYQSVMNYAKFGQYVLDYSDGTNGLRDTNDWEQIDLAYFQQPFEEDYDLSDARK